MDRVESYEQCTDLIREFKKGCKKTVTNFFFLPRELKTMIDRDNVYVQISENALVFFMDEREYSYIYYFLEEGTSFVIADTKKPLLLDFVARKSEYEKAEVAEKKRWQSSGFVFYKEYVRMQCSLGVDGYAARRDDLQCSGCELLCAGSEDAEAITALWRENLDQFSVPLPQKDEVLQMIGSQHVYCMKKAGEVAGAVYMDVTAGRCILKHLAVWPAFRRQGVGRAIMDYALRKMAEENVHVCSLWVAADNIAAHENYRKYGFLEEDKKSGRLIRRV